MSTSSHLWSVANWLAEGWQFKERRLMRLFGRGCLLCIMTSSLYSDAVAVRHHLAGMELLLSSRYMVPLRSSCGCSSREHEFLDLREFLLVIELLRAVQEKSLVYSKQKHSYTGNTRNWNLYSVLGNSKGRSSVRVTQAVVCDRSAALALGKKLPLRKLIGYFFPHICKSYLRVLTFPCLFPTFLGRMFWRDYRDGLYGSCPSEVPFQGFRWKNKAKPNFILEIAKCYMKYLN
jgi:hypothetical protein